MQPDRQSLRDLIEKPVSGFWGRDEKGVSATVQCRVIRNGDVGKDGKIYGENLPIRWMTQREIEKAGVTRDDSILVSSGAYTGNVGRVKPVIDCYINNAMAKAKKGAGPIG